MVFLLGLLFKEEEGKKKVKKESRKSLEFFKYSE